MRTKIRQLTPSNVRAIKDVDLRTRILDIGATYVTFEGAPDHALLSIQGVMDDYDAMGMAKGHPRSSLVAVRNKLRDAAAATEFVPGLVTAYVEVLS